MNIGYARVSTDDQNLDFQTDAIKVNGCETIYQEHASGKNTARLELENCLKGVVRPNPRKFQSNDFGCHLEHPSRAGNWAWFKNPCFWVTQTCHSLPKKFGIFL
jgi:hypothetical protein